LVLTQARPGRGGGRGGPAVQTLPGVAAAPPKLRVANSHRDSNFRPLECQWSLSSQALSLSLCQCRGGFIMMAWLVSRSLTWNLNKVELEDPSFLPVIQ